MTRDEAVRDQKKFMEVLGLNEHPTDHAYCPICGEERGRSRSASMMTRIQDDGTNFFKCMSCQAKGTVIDAVIDLRRTDFKGAAQILGIEMGKPTSYRIMNKPSGSNNGSSYKDQEFKFHKPIEPPIPVPDFTKMEPYITNKHKDMYKDWNAQPPIEFLYETRKITDKIVEEYTLGVDRLSFNKDGSIRRCQWVLPITDATGACYGVKTHWQGKPPISVKSGRRYPKCQWKCFGTVPKEKPKHIYITAWPAPELFDEDKWLFIHGGELKALSMLSAGVPSTAITGGESFTWTPNLISRFRGRRVCLLYDDDEWKETKTGRRFKPGEEWRDRCLEALSGAARQVECLTFSECYD